jgi:hypothetical protein
VSALHIAAKDLRLILRDRVAVLFLLVVPIAVITIVASTLGGDRPSSILLSTTWPTAPPRCCSSPIRPSGSSWRL